MSMVEMKNLVALEDATPLLEDPSALREFARREGYLYFHRLLSPGALLNLREKALAVCQAHGWLDANAPLLEGRVRESAFAVEGLEGGWPEFYKDIQKIRAFHALALSPELLRVFRLLFNSAVLAHSRNILRAIFPGVPLHTTPPHQDYIHILGTQDTWTAWIPCGDCPEELGGLSLVPGSYRWGVLPTQQTYGAGGAAVETPEDCPWAVADYACGDVVIFHSLTVHQGRDNATRDRLRLSVDFRYQPLDQPVQPSSLEPHMATTYKYSWEDVYAAWNTQGDSLPYYWKSQPLHFEPVHKT